VTGDPVPTTVMAGLLNLSQESYVWGMYQQRVWDFFPVGECFRKQYEEELTSAK